MKILSFHLKGKMAHFRRYYTNSSALSYTVPSRTTIAGIIAGLFGLERDSYYDLFSLEKCQIGLAVCSPLKKIIQKMNLLMIKNTNDLNGSQENHSQTATELIIPQNIRTGCLDYQIWFHHHDNELMERLEDLFRVYPAYGSKGISLGLGVAYNLGWLEPGDTNLEGEEIVPSKPEYIHSIIPSTKLVEISTKLMKNEQYALLKENLPLEFDQERKLTRGGIGSFIISLNGNPVPAVVSSVIKLNNSQNIIWLV